MWALGISVIEMAEVVPPRWKVHLRKLSTWHNAMPHFS